MFGGSLLGSTMFDDFRSVGSTAPSLISDLSSNTLDGSWITSKINLDGSIITGGLLDHSTIVPF